ncbi:sigma E regulatory protein, MucB/RseB [Modicisalibacter muralis]|uniref:Sigma E regulatory protein, MucB/RseB n=1 Tax=Modicisalibacter muralis TaxID=119000 RepID=A0A1G9MAV5_9GAMM|nr:MucB/RseB C-terminal domain-containing protein [Halomonas muralis]SDL70785.1 sigma E regulatory protein, MucB/RseB [Halomonas muralis]
MIRPSFAAFTAAATCMLLASPPGFAASSETSGFDCQQLAEREKPDTPAEWLERSLWAGHCYIFQARAVRITSEGVRTLALSHDIENGIEREVASYLDGPAVVYERHGRIAQDVATGEADADTIGQNRASPSSIMSRLDQHYRLSIEGQERIAGRPSVRIDVEPLDNMRYGHRLWLDRETALPLKQVLVDIDGHILETFQMTELAQPRLYDDSVAFGPLQDIPPDPWQPEWLPAGYEPLPLPVSRSVTNTPLSHRLYSDGLSSFSVFIEPLVSDDRVLLPGIHRLGVSHAAVRHLRLGERVMQVVVMGEMPPQVLGRIAARLEYRPVSRRVSGVTQ